MKQTVIIALLLLSALGSCRRGCDVSPELTAMDSLFPQQADSVLRLLETVHYDKLAGNADDNRAYAAMLYSQARNTLLLEVTDSETRAIDSAVKHFRGTPLEARALIFAGTTREDIGDAPAAIRLYKQAELAAIERNDTFFTAYAQMRMAWLYQCQFVAYPEAISRYRKAIEGFGALDDKQRIMMCYECMGDCYSIIKSDSAIVCYRKLLEMAIPLNDTFRIAQSYSGMAGHYFFTGRNDTLSYRCAMQSLVNDSTRKFPRAIAVCCAYRTGLPLPVNSDVSDLIRSGQPGDSVMYYRTMAERARKNKDILLYYVYVDSASEVSDLTVLSSKSVDVIKAEKAVEAENRDKIFGRINRVYFFSIAAAIAVIVGIMVWSFRRLRREREMVANLRDQVTELEDKAENYQSMSEHVRSTLVHQRVVLTRISQTINENADSSPAHTARLLRTIIREYRPDEQFWDELKEYVEQNYNLILTDLKEKYPKLSEPYVRIICLTCVDCSPTEMMTLMGFSSTAVVANYKSAITRKIMRVDLPLNEIVDRYR